MTDAAPEPARVWIETYGCQMNSYDSAAMYGILVEHGYRRAASAGEADVVILNTCSVRDLAEHKVDSRIGELRSARRRGGSEAAVVGVAGCMAERLGDGLARGRNRADLVLGVDRYAELPRMVADALANRGREALVATGHRDDVHYVAPPEAYPTNNSHLVTIHKGCDYRCTYCIVPATRGPQREKPPQVIEAEVRAVVAAGGRRSPCWDRTSPPTARRSWTSPACCVDSTASPACAGSASSPATPATCTRT